MARPKEMNNATHMGIMIDKDVLEDLKHYTRKAGMNVSEVVREVVEKWIEKQKAKIL